MKKRICSAALSLCLSASMALSAAALDVDQARELLGQHYITPLPAAAQQAQTLDELFSALNDPYTLYYTAEEYASFLESVNGEQVVGIGVSVRTVFDDGFLILSVLPDGPAHQAGLQEGDVVIAVDGKVLIPQDNVAALITGEEGSSVTVTVRRADGSTADFTLERRAVQIPIVTFEQQGSIGYFDCTSFGESTAENILTVLSDKQDDTAVWVMDLQSNPGGVAESAAATATHFAGGNIMVYFRDGQGDYYITRTSPIHQAQTDKPLILLTGPSSASAAELFAGAIRDHGAGIAIGQRTFGKGIAQIALDEVNTPEFFQGDALKLTAYQFFSPDGLTCHLMGVLPTLMLDKEHISPVVELLSSPAPEYTNNWLRLDLAEQSFYLPPKVCRDNPEALNILLSALPPAARLYRGHGQTGWNEITRAQAAAWKKVELSPRTFSDVENSPYRTAIDTLACYGLLSGDAEGNFLPENSLTRGELSAMLAAAFRLPAQGDISFSDVSPDAWYAGAVSAMAARGFLVGTDQGRFEPERIVTNQELYTALSDIAVWASMSGYEEAGKTFSALQWLEFHVYPEWAQEPARNLSKLGLDVDRENPSAPVTRGQTAQMLFELMDIMGMFWY